MISKTFQYENLDGNQVEETAWFHVTEAELTEHLDLKDRFDPLAKRFLEIQGTEQELTRAEVQEVLSLVKFMTKLGYGERYQRDGKTRFRKTEESFQDFQDSGAHDAFLWSLFSAPEQAILFMNDIMPRKLAEEARAIAEQQGITTIPEGVKIPQDRQSRRLTMDEARSEVEKLRPASPSVADLERELMAAKRAEMDRRSSETDVEG